MAELPKLPKGFTVVQDDSLPELPKGYSPIEEPVKKKVDTPASKAGSEPLAFGSNPFQDTKPLAPTVLNEQGQKEFIEKNKDYKPAKEPKPAFNPAAFKRPPTYAEAYQEDPTIVTERERAKNLADDKAYAEGKAERNKFSDDLNYKAASGWSTLGRMVSVIPSAMVDNAIKMFAPTSALPLDAELAGKIVEQQTGLPEAYNPLSPNNGLAEMYRKRAEENQAIAGKGYNTGAWEALKRGEYADFGKLMAMGVLESLPTTLGIMASRGAGLGSAGSLIGMGLGTHGTTYQDLKAQHPEMDKNTLLINSVLTGLGEAGSELFGADMLYNQGRKLFMNGQKEQAKELVQKGIKSYLDNAFKKTFVGSAMLSDMGGEVANQVWKNAADKWSKVRPDVDYLDGVGDAALISLGMTGTMAGAAKGLSKIVNSKTKAQVQADTQAIERIQSEMENPNIPEETKAVLMNQVSNLTEKVNEQLEKDNTHYNNLSNEQKEKVDALSEQSEKIEAALNDPNVSEETKAILRPQLDEISQQIDSVQPEEKVAVKEDKVATNETVSPEKVQPETPVVDETAKAQKPEEVKPVETKAEPNPSEPVATDKEAADPSEPVFKKAEDDLSSLKQVADKTKKYEASIKRLSEAKQQGLITEKEFNEQKQRFDDVMADSNLKVPKVEIDNVNDEAIKNLPEEVRLDIEKRRQEELKTARTTRGLIAQQTLIPEINAKYDAELRKAGVENQSVQKEPIVQGKKLAGDPLRKLADKIEAGKINKLGGFRASTGFDAAWDGSLTIIAASLRGAANTADAVQKAIQAGLDYIRSEHKDWYNSLPDQKEFDRQFEEHWQKEAGTVEPESADSPKANEPANDNKKAQSDNGQKSVSEKFSQLAHKSIESDEIRNTMNNIERETGRELDWKEKEYKWTKHKDAFAHGAEVVEAAKEEFGLDNYVSGLLDFLKNNKSSMSVENTSLITISLEMDLERRILQEPQNAGLLNKQLKLVRDVSTQQQRSAAIATGYGILRQIARYGYNLKEATNKLFTKKELVERNRVDKAVQATAEEIQQQAMENEQAKTETEASELVEADLEQAIAEGVDKRIHELYEALPSKRRERADKAIAALDRIQKRLRSKTYESTIGIPVAIIDMGITTIKGAIKAGVNVADAIELGINRIKKKYGKDWAKEAEFRKDMLEGFKSENIDLKEGKKVKTDAEKLEDRKQAVRERIDILNQQIADKRVELKFTEKLTDAELQALEAEERTLKKEAAQYLTSESKTRVEAAKEQSAIAKLEKEIRELNKQIAQGEKKAREAQKDPLDTPAINQLKGIKEAKMALLEVIDPSPKEFIQQTLIDNGFGTEITVTTKNGKEKRMILDWKKLAGEEGSVDKIRNQVEQALKDKGYSDVQIARMQNAFVKEYDALRAEVIQKSLLELNRMNTEAHPVEVKTYAARLAELYNLGLFDHNANTYDYLMNKAMGMSDFDQATFFKVKGLAQSLAELMKQETDGGRKISEFGLTPAINQINNEIRALLSLSAFKNANGAYKAALITKEYISLAQRTLLMSLKQLIENPFSGYTERAFNKLTYMSEKNDTKALRKQRAIASRRLLNDVIAKGGLDYGDINNPFLAKNNTEGWLNRRSESRAYHMFLSATMGKLYLEGMDGMHKVALTEGHFQRNLIKLLTDKTNPSRMSHDEAVKYVSEQLTGQNFEEATKKAKEIIDNVNQKAGKKILSDHMEAVDRLAMSIVKDALADGGKLSLHQIEASFKAGYTTAGYGMGHEANNLLSRQVGLLNHWTESKMNEAIREKDWNKAAYFAMQSILTKNIMNPFVGGGTNWVVLTLQKAGVPLVLEEYVHRKPIDLSSEQGLKDLEKALASQANFKSAMGRVVIGAAATFMTFAALKASGMEDDFDKWLKKNSWAQKWVSVISPQVFILMMANKNKELGKYFKQLLNIKVDNFNDAVKLADGIGNVFSDKDKNVSKGYGQLGEVIGNKLSTPLIPHKLAGDVRSVYRGLTGQEQVKKDYNVSGFANGYFKNGLIDFMGLRPEGDKGNRIPLSPEMQRQIDEAKKQVEALNKSLNQNK